MNDVPHQKLPVSIDTVREQGGDPMKLQSVHNKPTAGLKHRSQVRSGCRSGHRSGQVRSQVTSGHRSRQVRSGHRSGQREEYFSAKEIDYIFGVFGFINGVDNVNWSPYRDFGGRTSYLPLGLYHASVKRTSNVFNANTPLPKRLVLCSG